MSVYTHPQGERERKHHNENHQNYLCHSFAGTPTIVQPASQPAQYYLHTLHYALAFKKPRTLPTISSSPLQT